MGKGVFTLSLYVAGILLTTAAAAVVAAPLGLAVAGAWCIVTVLFGRVWL